MYSKGGKNSWALFLLLLAGLVLGSFIGHYLGGIPQLAWLRYGQNFGFAKPLAFELGIVDVTFGIMIKINIVGVLGAILAVVAYKKL